MGTQLPPCPPMSNEALKTEKAFLSTTIAVTWTPPFCQEHRYRAARARSITLFVMTDHEVD